MGSIEVNSTTQTIVVNKDRTVNVVPGGPVGNPGPQGPQGVRGPVGPEGPAGSLVPEDINTPGSRGVLGYDALFSWASYFQTKTDNLESVWQSYPSLNTTDKVVHSTYIPAVPVDRWCVPTFSITTVASSGTVRMIVSIRNTFDNSILGRSRTFLDTASVTAVAQGKGFLLPANEDMDIGVYCALNSGTADAAALQGSHYFRVDFFPVATETSPIGIIPVDPLYPEDIGVIVSSQEDVESRLPKAGGTLTGDLTIANSSATIFFQETDGAADKKLWRFRANSNALNLSARTDNDNLDSNVFIYARDLKNLTLAPNGSVIVPEPTGPDQAVRKQDLDTKLDKSGGEAENITVKASFPTLDLIEDDQGANGRIWGISPSGQVLRFQALNDNYSLVRSFFTYNRSNGELYLNGVKNIASDFTVLSNTPTITITENDQAANAKSYHVKSTSGSFQIFPVDDAGGMQGVGAPFRMDRDGSVSFLSAPSVFMPPPTHPTNAARKEDVDAKVAKSGDTMSGNLTIESTFPAVNLTETDGAADDKRLQIAVNGGNFTVRVLNDDGSVAYSPIVLNRTMRRLSFGQANEVLVPANSGTGGVNQAARITQRDPATGRLQIDGVECGQTPWVDATPWLVNGWVANTLMARRHGANVEFVIAGLNGVDSTGIAFLQVPSGWQMYASVSRLAGVIVDGTGISSPNDLYDVAPLISQLRAGRSITNGHGTFSVPAGSGWPASI